MCLLCCIKRFNLLIFYSQMSLVIYKVHFLHAVHMNPLALKLHFKWWLLPDVLVAYDTGIPITLNVEYAVLGTAKHKCQHLAPTTNGMEKSRKQCPKPLLQAVSTLIYILYRKKEGIHKQRRWRENYVEEPDPENLERRETLFCPLAS